MNLRLSSRQQASHEFSGVPLVATASVFYEDLSDIRYELSLQTAESYRDLGVPYVVVDASPPVDGHNNVVFDAHRSRGAIVLRADTPGIATQRQQGVNYSLLSGADKIVGHESEKTLMPSFVDTVSNALDRADILVVGRSDKAENSLPPFMQRTERLAGWILQQSHDLPADALCGPRGFTAAGAEQLALYPSSEKGMNNWIYLYHTPLQARAAGLTIDGVKVDLMYPQQMVDQETGNDAFDAKRYMQFKLQLEYLLGRDDVRPEANDIARIVLSHLAGDLSSASMGEQNNTITSLESAFEPLGYKIPAIR